MAKGAEAKEAITAKILSTFEGSFKHEKEIRIPIVENGEVVQIKVTLTAAKVNVEQGSDVALPSPEKMVKTADVGVMEPTEEEKKNISDMLQAFGFLK